MCEDFHQVQHSVTMMPAPTAGAGVDEGQPKRVINGRKI